MLRIALKIANPAKKPDTMAEENAEEKIRDPDAIINRLTKKIKQEQDKIQLAHCYFERGKAYYAKKDWVAANNDFISGIVLNLNGTAYEQDFTKLKVIASQLGQCNRNIFK